MEAARFSRNKFYVAAALCLIALLAYSDSFTTGFSVDSLLIILKDPRLSKVTAANFQQILSQDYWWPNFHTGLYRPLTTATFLFNYAVLGNGENSVGYHIVNFLLHAINVWLLFMLASRLFGRTYPAFFAAALWAVHPIDVEAVTNLVGRSDELAAMAILGGVLLYGSAPLRGRGRTYAVVGLFVIAILGGLAKESAAVLIAMMLLWDMFQAAGSWRDWLWRDWLKLRGPFCLAATLGLGVFLWARWRVLGGAPPAEFPYVDNPLGYADFWIAKLTALKVICLDLWLMVFPVQLSFDRSYNQIHLVGWNDPAAYAAIPIVAGLLAAAILRRRQDPLMFWCAGFFAIALLPVSNLVVSIGSIMAERFLYLPSAAFAIALTELVLRSRWRVHAPLILGMLIALYAARTYIRNRDWQSDLTLASHDAAVVPESFKVHDILASALLNQTRSNIDAAIREEEIAWDIVRRLPPARVFTQIPTNLAIYYRVKGDRPGGPISAVGRDWYLKSLNVLLEARRDSLASGDAYDELQRAQGKPVTLRLEKPDVYLQLGLTYHGLGRYEEARDAYNYAKQLQPADPRFYAALADNYAAAGNLQWAAIALEEKMLQEGPEPATAAALQNIFAKLPGGSCALSMVDGVARLNMGCPAVNVCLVWADLAQTYYQARNHDQALEIKRTAMAAGCPAQR